MDLEKKCCIVNSVRQVDFDRDFAYDLTAEQGQENFENEGKDQDCQKVGCQTKLVDVPQVNKFL